jgi:hypothetical protein
MTPHASAIPTPGNPSSTLIVFRTDSALSGHHLILDEDATRRLRDELNDCLTGRVAREMAGRWEGSE